MKPGDLVKLLPTFLRDNDKLFNWSIGPPGNRQHLILKNGSQLYQVPWEIMRQLSPALFQIRDVIDNIYIFVAPEHLELLCAS